MNASFLIQLLSVKSGSHKSVPKYAFYKKIKNQNIFDTYFDTKYTEKALKNILSYFLHL